MSIQTQVIWNWPLDAATRDSLLVKITEVEHLETQHRSEVAGPGENQMTKLHWWINEEAAEDWIAFVEPFNPVSATIIN